MVVALAIVVAVLAGYIFGGLGKGGAPAGQTGPTGQGPTGPSGPGGNPTDNQGGQPASGITEVHLESVPIGTQIGPGVVGTPTTVFGKWLMMGINGQVNAPSGTQLTLKIFDANGTQFPTNYPGMQISGPGGFGSCCMIFPQTAGNYVMKFYLDGTEAKSLNFTVVADDYCESDSDCACGTNVLTGDCLYGNKNLVDTSRQCPDFCVWMGPNGVDRITPTCVNNTCV